jgi:hypothetical protein
VSEDLPDFEDLPELADDQQDEVDIDQVGDELPAEQQVVAAPPQFNYNDRLYALGFSGSGKSEILNILFSGIASQRLLIDNKPEFAIADIPPVHTPGEIDWTAPIIHYQPAPGTDCSQYEEIFAMAFTRRGLTVCVHEFGALVDYNANKAGRYLISYISQGYRLGLGLLAGTQRPVMVPVHGTTEANHVLVFAPHLSRREDMKAAADLLSPVAGRPLNGDELGAELAAIHQEHGEYSFLWKDRRNGQLVAIPPLGDHLRAANIVQRIEDA